ncbi:MAG: protein translocase subunit SecD [Anaerolineae bacterium]
MRDRNVVLFVLIVLLTAFAAWVDTNDRIRIELGPIRFDRDIHIRQGLDLQGGLHVLLEADVPATEKVLSEAMDAVATIVDNRVNALGVTEPLVQRQGDRRIIVELPGIEDPDQAVATLKGTGLLEFIDAGYDRLQEGMVVKTTFGQSKEGSASEETVPTPTVGVSETATLSLTAEPTTEVTVTATLTPTGETPGTVAETPTPTPASEKVYPTIMTGKHLKTASAGQDEYGRPEIDFELTDEGAKIFADFTKNNVGKILAITMDGVVISAPVIQTPILEGRGRITSEAGFPLEYARSIAVQLRYGALPVPLKVVETRSVGPTLGQDSVQKSIRAGLIGLVVVLLFMLVYYRLPGSLADLALLIYASLNLMVFKLMPVTLTLPGITGFILSTGMAVDANILIFERMKEELRAGKTLRSAISAGFDRAWTSIRDSNLSTLLTCIILFWFGSQFGASIVKGFAVTLFIGVVISMFTAITVTRTFLTLVFEFVGEGLRKRKWLLGL